MRISDWSSDVCSSDLTRDGPFRGCGHYRAERCRAADRLRVPAICAVQAHDGGRDYWFRVVGAATARAAVASCDPRAGAGIARSRPAGPIGRAACWERVVEYGDNLVAAVSLQKK